MDSDSRRNSLKVVRVLCDGCERAIATAFCTACGESACLSCTDQLHVGGRRTKRAPARTCKGRSMKDLGKTVGVLALCVACRSRPAHRYRNGEVYSLCKECRRGYAPLKAAPAGDIVKRVIVDEIHRTKSSSSSHPTSSSVRPTSSSLRISRSGNHRSKHKKDFHTSDDYSTGDDATDLGFSGDSSAE